MACERASGSPKGGDLSPDQQGALCQPWKREKAKQTTRRWATHGAFVERQTSGRVDAVLSKYVVLSTQPGLPVRFLVSDCFQRSDTRAMYLIKAQVVPVHQPPDFIQSSGVQAFSLVAGQVVRQVEIAS